MCKECRKYIKQKKAKINRHHTHIVLWYLRSYHGNTCTAAPNEAGLATTCPLLELLEPDFFISYSTSGLKYQPKNRQQNPGHRVAHLMSKSLYAELLIFLGIQVTESYARNLKQQKLIKSWVWINLYLCILQPQNQSKTTDAKLFY